LFSQTVYTARLQQKQVATLDFRLHRSGSKLGYSL